MRAQITWRGDGAHLEHFHDLICDGHDPHDGNHEAHYALRKLRGARCASVRKDDDEEPNSQTRYSRREQQRQLVLDPI